MSKSVLVIDTPVNCEWCTVRGGSFYCHCKLNHRNIEDIKKKPDWCPLKPLPEKMEMIGKYNQEYFQKSGKMPSYKVGWNACIDEITGGEADGEINT